LSPDFGLIGTFLDYYAERHRFIQPIIEMILENGFDYTLFDGKGQGRRLHEEFRNIKKMRRELTRTVLSGAADSGGFVEVTYEDEKLVHFDYRDEGVLNYRVGEQGEDSGEALKNAASLILAMRQRLETFVEEETVSQIATLISGFFSRVPPDGYKLTLHVGGEMLFSGGWTGDRMVVEIHRVRPLFQLAVLLFQGVDFSGIRVRTPLDFITFFEKLRTGIRRIAGILSSENHRLEVSSQGLTVLRVGAGVDPYPSDAFGNVEIRPENLFRLYTQEARRKPGR